MSLTMADETHDEKHMINAMFTRYNAKLAKDASGGLDCVQSLRLYASARKLALPLYVHYERTDSGHFSEVLFAERHFVSLAGCRTPALSDEVAAHEALKWLSYIEFQGMVSCPPDADEMRNWQKTGSDLLRKMELEDAAYSVKEGNLEVPEDQKYQASVTFTTRYMVQSGLAVLTKSAAEHKAAEEALASLPVQCASDKTPKSALAELCNSRRLPAPTYKAVSDGRGKFHVLVSTRCLKHVTKRMTLTGAGCGSKSDAIDDVARQMVIMFRDLKIADMLAAEDAPVTSPPVTSPATAPPNTAPPNTAPPFVDYWSQLQMHCQRRGLPVPTYSFDEDGSRVEMTYSFKAGRACVSKSDAERQVALAALKVLTPKAAIAEQSKSRLNELCQKWNGCKVVYNTTGSGTSFESEATIPVVIRKLRSPSKRHKHDMAKYVMDCLNISLNI